MKLLCKLFGHLMNITGVTGKYRWCSRCAHRVQIAEGVSPDRINEAIATMLAVAKSSGYGG